MDIHKDGNIFEQEVFKRLCDVNFREIYKKVLYVGCRDILEKMFLDELEDKCSCTVRKQATENKR